MKETPEQELKRLRALAAAQYELLEGLRSFVGCMPMCMGDVIENYNDLCERVNYLAEPGVNPDDLDDGEG